MSVRGRKDVFEIGKLVFWVTDKRMISVIVCERGGELLIESGGWSIDGID
jgi:hypothetical protein